MTTTFKIQLSLIGNAVKQILGPTPAIEIRGSPTNAELRPFKSLPTETSAYSNQSELIHVTEEGDELMLPRFSLKEVLTHDMAHDCWTIIYDRVYDLTDFLYKHPGGDDILLEYAGRDATLAFKGVGHSKFAETALEPYLIGILEDKDRLWMQPWGVRRESR